MMLRQHEAGGVSATINPGPRAQKKNAAGPRNAAGRATKPFERHEDRDAAIQLAAQSFA
jgi:hypothetical protein